MNQIVLTRLMRMATNYAYATAFATPREVAKRRAELREAIKEALE